MTEFKNSAPDKRAFNIIEIFIVFSVAFLIVQISDTLPENSLVLRQLVVWAANVVMLFLIWLGLKLRGESFKKYGFSFGKPSLKKALKAFAWSLLVFVAAIVAFMIGSTIMINITGLPQQADMSSYAYLQENTSLFILTLLGVYIVSSFGEEVIYRGFLITRISDLGLNGKASKVVAVFLSAVIFGLAHFGWGITGVVQTFFMGLTLGYFYLKLDRNIWILVLAHMYMDTILMVQMYLGS